MSVLLVNCHWMRWNDVIVENRNFSFSQVEEEHTISQSQFTMSVQQSQEIRLVTIQLSGDAGNFNVKACDVTITSSLPAFTFNQMKKSGIDRK